MKNADLYAQLIIAKQAKRKQFAVLLDPDHLNQQNIALLTQEAVAAQVDYLFVGGSLVMCGDMNEKISQIKQLCHLPIIIFPGGTNQICPAADAILLLSLVSGRNPDLLIGQHVIAAPMLKKSGLEILPTGYMLIDGGVPTTVSYMSHTNPIPRDKAPIAICTAMAAEMLGMKLIYLDAGSGAKNAIPADMIQAVSAQIDIPLIVGGGIRTPEQAQQACEAGADLIVVGNALEQNPLLMREIAQKIHNFEQMPNVH
jgi:phosphoglycerol geranylgeranyltransferase